MSQGTPSPYEVLQRAPLPEVTELDPADGWAQWDLAVRLRDGAERAPEVAEP